MEKKWARGGKEEVEFEATAAPFAFPFPFPFPFIIVAILFLLHAMSLSCKTSKYMFITSSLSQSLPIREAAFALVKGTPVRWWTATTAASPFGK